MEHVAAFVYRNQWPPCLRDHVVNQQVLRHNGHPGRSATSTVGEVHGTVTERAREVTSAWRRLSTPRRAMSTSVQVRIKENHVTKAFLCRWQKTRNIVDMYCSRRHVANLLYVVSLSKYLYNTIATDSDCRAFFYPKCEKMLLVGKFWADSERLEKSRIHRYFIEKALRLQTDASSISGFFLRKKYELVLRSRIDVLTIFPGSTGHLKISAMPSVPHPFCVVFLRCVCSCSCVVNGASVFFFFLSPSSIIMKSAAGNITSVVIVWMDCTQFILMGPARLPWTQSATKLAEGGLFWYNILL